MKRYSLALFILTLVTGIFEIAGISIHDVFGGFVLLVISATFLRGITSNERAYFYFASLMLAVFGILYLLVLLANGLDAVIVGDEWNPASNLRPEILFIPLALPGVWLMNKVRREVGA